jgi:DNA-binding transcriptional ArsR family regulator
MRRLSPEQVTLVALRARALGDPTRVRILTVLARGEQPVGAIAATLVLEPSTISKHLQVLHHAGLVLRRRAASTVIYRLASPELADWCSYLSSVRLAGGEHGQ